MSEFTYRSCPLEILGRWGVGSSGTFSEQIFLPILGGYDKKRPVCDASNTRDVTKNWPVDCGVNWSNVHQCRPCHEVLNSGLGSPD